MGADGEALFGKDALRWQRQAAAVADVADVAAAVAWPNRVMAKLSALGCLEETPVIAQSIMCSVLLIPLSARFLCQQLCKCDVQRNVKLNILFTS